MLFSVVPQCIVSITGQSICGLSLKDFVCGMSQEDKTDKTHKKKKKHKERERDESGKDTKVKELKVKEKSKRKRHSKAVEDDEMNELEKFLGPPLDSTATADRSHDCDSYESL